MAALLSVWLGLLALALSLTMVFYRPAFNDVLVLVNLYFACPLTLTCAGLVLWATRRHKAERGPARLQAQVGALLAVIAAAIVYLLVQNAQRIGPA